jgi:hypothetical protein
MSFAGHKHTQEFKDKIRLVGLANKGRKFTEEHKAKISRKGKKHTAETKRKMSLAHKGQKPWNYEGKTKLNKLIRCSVAYKKWRTAIFERDDYVCQICGKRGGKLHVDHFPKPFSLIIRENNIKSIEEALDCDELWDTKNNRVLCVSCHKETSTYLVGARHVLQSEKK